MTTRAAGEKPQTIAYTISAASAKRRLLAAIEDEGLNATPIDIGPIAQRIKRVPDGLAALVHDLSPWTAGATGALEQLRKRTPNLPFLIYPPLRPGIGPLIVAAVRIEMTDLQLQLDVPDEVGRLKTSIRSMLDSRQRRWIMNRLVYGGVGLSKDAQTFCACTLEMLESANGGALTAQEVARRLGTTRRTLERHCLVARMPPPAELLSWMLALYTSSASRGDPKRVARIAERLGLDPRRIRRVRARLHSLRELKLEEAAGFEEIVSALALRCMELRYEPRHPARRASAPPAPPAPPAPLPKAAPGRRWTVIYPRG